MKKIRGDKPVGVIIRIYMEISQGNDLCIYLYLKLAKMSCSSFYLFSYRRVEQVLPRGEGWHQWEEGGGRERG
jgi:hypothetical protein